MKCQSRIQDEFGGKYKCLKEATKKITTKTYASHLKREVITTSCLCTDHAHKKRNKYNYKLKNCHKQGELIQEDL